MIFGLSLIPAGKLFISYWSRVVFLNLFSCGIVLFLVLSFPPLTTACHSPITTNNYLSLSNSQHSIHKVQSIIVLTISTIFTNRISIKLHKNKTIFINTKSIKEKNSPHQIDLNHIFQRNPLQNFFISLSQTTTHHIFQRNRHQIDLNL